MVVLSRGRPRLPQGVLSAASLDDALALCAGDSEVFVAGGAGVFAAALPRADRLYLTRVHAVVEGDVLFPPFDGGGWREVSREDHPADERHPWPYSFVTLERRPAPGPAAS
jgi:dihydrofolate reductase